MLLFLVIPILVANAQFIDYCPPEEVVYPCYCESNGEYGEIECDSINHLEDVLNNTRGLNVSYSFLDARLDDIPSNLFEGQISTNLEFRYCSIHSFGDRPFTGLEDTLTSLSVYGSVHKDEKDLESFPMAHLKNLKYLIFEENDITRLGNDWFKGGPKTLTEVNVGMNDIEELGDEAFASLVNLKQLWLDGNRISNISRSMFPMPANKMREFQLSNNKIEILPEDIFENMTALRVVTLIGNKLTTIPEDTWGGVWDQLKEVYLGGNPGFTCDQGMKWIYQKSTGEKRKLPKVFTGRCKGGKNDKKSLKSLKIEDFE